jgi:hypothetical protein
MDGRVRWRELFTFAYLNTISNSLKTSLDIYNFDTSNKSALLLIDSPNQKTAKKLYALGRAHM